MGALDTQVIQLVVVAAALGLAVTAFSIKWYRERHGKEPALQLSALDDRQVIDEFRRRRRAAGMSFLVVLVAGLALALLLRSPAGASSTAALVAFAVLIVAMVRAVFVYRCPRCGQPPWDPDTASTRRPGPVLVNPDRCATCGARLKADRRV